MRRIAASALLAGLALSTQAQAQSGSDEIARALADDPVYVHPRAADRLTVPERGRVRLAIVREAIGRIKVVVVPEAVAARSGGIRGFANDVDHTIVNPGTLIAVAGPSYWAVTSYPRPDEAASALRAAVTERGDDRLVDELLAAIPRIARVDPGPSDDLQQDGTPAPGPGPGPAATDDFLDDVGDTFRTGVLLAILSALLPFVIVVAVLVARARRRRAHEAEVRELGEESADEELVTLGDEIRELDLDTSMPNASRAALAEYEQAIARYDQANELLEGEPSQYRVDQARAAIAAGRRHIDAARQRLG
jgi:hypothetical protein